METIDNEYISEIIKNVESYDHFDDYVTLNHIKFYVEIKKNIDIDIPHDIWYSVNIKTDSVINSCIYKDLFYTRIDTNLIDVITVLQNMITKDGFIYSKMLDKIFSTKEIKNEVENRHKGKNIFFKIETTICSVCLEDCILESKCKHIICRECFIKIKDRKCPVCRQYFYESDNENDNESDEE